MYNIGGTTSSHPSESLDGFHRRENGDSHAAEKTMVSEVIYVDSVHAKHRSLDIPEAVVPPERPLCLQRCRCASREAVVPPESASRKRWALHAASKNLLMASTRRVPSSTVECRHRARRTTCEITTCRTPWPTSCLANIKMPMPMTCGCWAGKESR